MKRPATWKLATTGAALTGLGIVCAGTAMASPPEFFFKDPEGVSAYLEADPKPPHMFDNE